MFAVSEKKDPKPETRPKSGNLPPSQPCPRISVLACKKTQNHSRFCKTKPWPGCSEQVGGPPVHPELAATFTGTATMHIPPSASGCAGSPIAKICLLVLPGDPPRLLQPAHRHASQAFSRQNKTQPIFLWHPRRVPVLGCRHGGTHSHAEPLPQGRLRLFCAQTLASSRVKRTSKS